MKFLFLQFVVGCFIMFSVGYGSNDCPPVPHDCDPRCIVQLPHCRKCDCKEGSNFGMSFQNMRSAGTGGGGSPFNQGQDLSRTPFTSSIDALGTSMAGTGVGEVSGIGMGGMRNGLMSVPGMFLHGPSNSRHRSCLRGDIICPTYCLVIDEYGCKSCPCGPANGMGMPMVGKNTYKKKENSNNNCFTTLLCMLSCKDGYKLGPKGNDGCNTCECTKKKPKEEVKESNKDKEKSSIPNQTNNSTKNTGSGSGENSPFGTGFNPLFPGSSMGNSMGGMMGSGDGSGCTGPFCDGGKSMKSPFSMPGEKSGKDSDHCIGPSCSAPGNHNPGSPTPIKVPEVCQATDLCVKTCKYVVKLGAKMADGCPSCACEKNELGIKTTTAPKKQKLCKAVVDCIMNCKDGYRLKSATDGECPLCQCNQSQTPLPTLLPTTKGPGCTEKTLQCMKTCRHGYHIQSSPLHDCPICSCLPPPTKAPTKGVYSVLQECPETVHCMTSCTSGYSLEGGGSQCPHCKCNQGTIATLKCDAALSCPRGCRLGYKCGANGCPSCSCVEAKEIGITHTMTYIQTSLTCSSMFNCPSKCDFGYKTGNNGCPICRCLQPVTAVHLSAKEKCPDSAQCSTICPNGFQLKPVLGQECPLCECVQVASVVEPLQMMFEKFTKTCPETLACISRTNGYTTTSVKGQCPRCLCSESIHNVGIKENCPETFKCNSICEHGFSLRTVSGKYCPVCECATPIKVPVKTESIIKAVQLPSVTGTDIHVPTGGTHSNVGGLVTGHIDAGNIVLSGQTGPGALPGHTGLDNGVIPGKIASVVGVMPGLIASSVGGMHAELNGRLPHVTHVTSNHQALLSTPTIQGLGPVQTCIGPACSAKNGLLLASTQGRQFRENQCAVILTCVVSCKHGYRLGPKGHDGCPTCTCLK